MRPLMCLLMVMVAYGSSFCQGKSRYDVYFTGSYSKFGPNNDQGPKITHSNIFLLGLGIKKYVSKRIPVGIDYNAIIYREGEDKPVFYNWSNIYGEYLLLKYDNFNLRLTLGGAISDYGSSRSIAVLDKSLFCYLYTGSGVDFRLMKNLNLDFSVRKFSPLSKDKDRVGLLLFFAGVVLKL